MSRATSAAANFFSIIDLPNPSREGLKEPDVSARGDIVFDRVTFAYPSRPNVKVLDDISLRFGSGKNTAIVGASVRYPQRLVIYSLCSHTFSRGPERVPS